MQIQKSSGSSRERWIKALLPAAVIVAIYMLVLNLTVNRQMRSLREDLSTAEKQAVTEDAVASVFQQKSAAMGKVTELQDRIADAKTGIEESLATFTQAAPAERMMEIDQMCRDLSIGLLHQKSTSKIEVSKVREKSLKTLTDLTSKDAVTYRQLDVVAKYADMRTLLQRLPEAIDGVVPLGIELLKHDERAGGALAPGQRIWRIYLLM